MAALLSTKRAGRNKPVPRSVTPRSSQATTPIAAANRFDLLVGEQKCLVQSAQEGLQQALTFLEKASSKEEQESARLQVLSLLTRAEELVTTLKIVIEIKTELSHVQKELAESKKAKQDTREVQCRLQWLEQRLERMLLARRRARPGARSRRVQPMPNIQQPFTVHAARPPRYTRPGVGNRARAIEVIAPYSPTKSPTGSTTISDRDTLSISFRDSTVPASTPWKAESTATHSSPPLGTTYRSRSQQSASSKISSSKISSSKRSVSRDSDSWHSESEANWTMVDAYSNRMKDITQSQVLSSADDEQKQSLPEAIIYSRRVSVTFEETPQPLAAKDLLSPFSEGDEEKALSKEAAIEPRHALGSRPNLTSLSEQQQQQKVSKVSLDDSVYGFESPRAADVFGAISWNSLCLALNKNFVKPGSGIEVAHFSRGADLTIAMLRSVLDTVSSEVDSLRQQVNAAAKAATDPGPILLPSAGTPHRRTMSMYRGQSTMGGAAVPKLEATSRRTNSSSAYALHSAKDHNPHAVVLPSLDVVSANYPPAKPSRKIYGKKSRSLTYPRVSAAWGQSGALSPTRSASRTDSTNLWVPQDLQGSTGRRSMFRQRSVRSSKSKSTSRAPLADVDIFDRYTHQEKYIKHLLEQLESKTSENRINSIQALGDLSTRSSEQVEERLETIMMHDPDPTMRYEAMKSLIKLGVLGEKVLQFACAVLRQGGSELQCDLLNLLCKEKTLVHFNAHADDGSKEWCSIRSALKELLGGSHSCEVSLLATVLLLSQGEVEREKCVARLFTALEEGTPEHQSLALSCLVRCWHCCTSEVIAAALAQMGKLHNLQLRISAIDVLMAIGEDELLHFERDGLNVFEIVMQRLVNEPVQAVRVKLGLLLVDLGLDKKAKDMLLGRLESPSEVTRAEAVMALGGFELRNQVNIQTLLDCLELDPSTYVRVQVVRVLSQMKFYSSSVVNKMAEKSTGDGLIERECSHALQILSKNLNLCKVED